MTIFGNLAQQAAFLTLLRSGQQVLCLEGDQHLGKSSFLRDVVPELVPNEDMLMAADGSAGVHEAREFASTEPVSGDFKVLAIADVDRLSDPAQDAYLKLLEEPPPRLRVVMTALDLGWLHPALRSRVRRTVRWAPLAETEMQSFAATIEPADPELLAMVKGHPGIYSRAHGKQAYKDLFHSVLTYVSGHGDPFMDPPPAVLEKMSNADDRSVIAHLCRFAALSSGGSAKHVRAVLVFCSTIASVPSANAQLHWSMMAAQMSSSLYDRSP